ncbi:MAG TPA: endolytic transglycosylase MltG [Bacteroidia bacterium]|jgi:UPF0755 protein|nr:endolytic transglycosylase MltG [Bacteroidia bacterium]
MKLIRKIILLAIFAAIGFAGYWAYVNLYKPNVNLEGKNFKYVYIPTGSDFETTLNALYSENVIENHKTFEWMAKRMDLDKNIHPGRYRINNRMNNRQIILMLKNGKEEKVKLTFNSQIRTKEEFIEYLDSKLELNFDELDEYLSDDVSLEKEYGLDPDNIMTLILPNTYDVSWIIKKEELFAQIKKYFNSVWTKDRRDKCKKMGYTVVEATTLASIVQGESAIQSEQQKIAGVYINRLKKNMAMQADPTLKFANCNFDVQRVTNADKQIDSPYNTYKYKGLPPGPICLVNLQSLDAVLNYTKHNFVFFCARPDLGGYSDFSSSYEEHLKYADAYQKALDAKGIKR